MRIFTTILATLVGSILFAQFPQQIRFSPSDTTTYHQVIEHGGGSLLVASETAFGNDSSQWDLNWCDTTYQVTTSRAFKFSTSRALLNDAIPHNGHRMFCGVALAPGGQRYPLLLNLQGTIIDHSIFFSNLLYDQTELIGMEVSNDTTYALYTSSADLAPAFYRINILTDTTATNVVAMTANSDVRFRMLTTEHGLGPTVHLAGGTGAFTTEPLNMLAMVAQTAPTGVIWSRMYDMGSEATEIEEVRGLTQLADGSVLAVIQYSDTMDNTQSAVLKLGPTGVPVWCNKLRIEQNEIMLEAIDETAAGNLLVVGSKAGNDGIIVLLNDTGSIISQHVFFDGTDVHFNAISRPAQGRLTVSSQQMIMELSEDLEGCELYEYTDIIAESYSPIVTTVLLDNDSFIALSSPLQASEVNTATTLQEDCFFTSIPKEPVRSENVLAATPNPTEGWVRLSGMAIDPMDEVVVMTMQGRVVERSSYGSGIDLSYMAKGAYLVSLTSDPRRHVVVIKH